MAFEWDATIGDHPGCLPLTSLTSFRNQLCQAVEEVDLPATPGHVFLAMARAVARAKRARVIMEKTPHHVLHAGRIVRAIPDARFVVLWCDAPDHLRSLKGQADLLYHPAAAATAWRRYDAAIRDVLRNGPDRSLVVRYSDLATRPAPELARISTFLELSNVDWPWCLPGFYSGLAPGEPLPELSPGDWFWSRVINGVGRDVASTTPFRDMVSVLESLTLLPRFVVGHLRQNLPEVEGSWLAYYRNWLGSKERA